MFRSATEERFAYVTQHLGNISLVLGNHYNLIAASILEEFEAKEGFSCTHKVYEQR